MFRRWVFLAVVGAALVVADQAAPTSRYIKSETGFQTVVRQMRSSGGVVTLRRGSYDTLAVTNRSGRWLTIRARPGVRVRNFVIRNAARVRLVDVRVKEGRLNVHSSRQVKLNRVRLVRSRMSLAAANFVTISRSQFTRCGENREACFATGWGTWASSHVRVIASRFYDCYGCDFIRGHAYGFVLRGSVLERAVPGPCGTAWECNHQDGVQINRGAGVLIENNRFGLTFQGAGQLYFSKAVDGVTIRNNVFFGTDALLPDYVGWAAIVIGNHDPAEKDLPSHVAIVNNTILTGAPRPDGLANSVILSPAYANVPVEERPLIANNVLGLLRNPERLCTLGGVVVANAVKDGAPCIEGGIFGDPFLSERGEPMEGSPLVDAADPAWATPVDMRGWPRDATPDIGAFELVR